MRFQGRCYRGHDPRWSFTPTSGEGAAKTGGRFNRRGEPTLYLAHEIITAIAECMQGLQRRLHPLTMCEYDVDCAPIADLASDNGRVAHGVTADELACPWLSLVRANSVPPSWQVADRLREEGFAGIIVPSFAPDAASGARNLVLWSWSDALPCKVSVYDPRQRLPRDQQSWQ